MSTEQPHQQLYNQTFYKKNHDFHIVNPSVIPVLVSSVVFFFAYSLVQFLHLDAFSTNSLNSLYVGLFSLIVVVNLWILTMVYESAEPFVYTAAVEQNLLMGMLLFICSEVFLFVSVFWSFFHSSLCPSIFVGATWPPAGIASINPWHIPFLNTLLLLTSGVTVNCFFYLLKDMGTSIEFYVFYPLMCFKHFRDGSSRFLGEAHAKFVLHSYALETLSLRQRDLWEILYGSLVGTIILGAIFLGVQVFEYIHSAFSISDSIFGSVFYMSTGLHGMHVFLGLTMLSYCLVRTLLGDFNARQSLHISTTCTVWYWHFVDVVWLFLFIFVYIWGC